MIAAVECATTENEARELTRTLRIIVLTPLSLLRSYIPARATYLPIMTSLFFSTPVDIDVVLEDSDERQTVDVKLDKGRRERVPLYMDGESVKGAVTVRPKDGKRLEHTGIKVQFIGTIGTRIAASFMISGPQLTIFSYYYYRDVL